MSQHLTWRGVVALFILALACRADWNEGGPHKMHYPQLPDPFGWDIDVTHYTLADDWVCTEMGLVQQVHFWISWTNDFVGGITNVHLSVHSNFPGPPWSQPAELLWEDDFPPAQFKTRLEFAGPQGWYDPVSNWWLKPEHFQVYQVNVALKPINLFTQHYGMIYWLDIRLAVTSGLAGWKTSITNFMDDATFWNQGMWHEMHDPYEPVKSLDMAFVIDPLPEPAGLLLLVLCGGVLTRRRG